MNIKLLLFTTLMIVTLYAQCVKANEHDGHNNNNNNNRNRNRARNINKRSEINHQKANSNNASSRGNLKDQTHQSNSNSNQHVAKGHDSVQNRHNVNGRNPIHHHNNQGNIKPVGSNQNQRSNHETVQEKKEQIKADLEKFNENVDNIFNKYYELQAKKTATTTQTPSKTTTKQQNNPQQENIKSVESNQNQRSNQESAQDMDERLNSEFEKLEKNIDNLFDKYFDLQAKKLAITAQTPSPTTSTQQNNPQQHIEERLNPEFEKLEKNLDDLLTIYFKLQAIKALATTQTPSTITTTQQNNPQEGNIKPVESIRNQRSNPQTVQEKKQQLLAELEKLEKNIDDLYNNYFELQAKEATTTTQTPSTTTTTQQSNPEQDNIKPVESIRNQRSKRETVQEKKEQLLAELEKLEKIIDDILNDNYELQAKKAATTTQTPSTITSIQQSNPQQDNIKPVESIRNQRSKRESPQEIEERLKPEFEKLERNIDNLFNKYYELQAKKAAATTQIPSTTTPTQQNNAQQQQTKLADIQNCQTDVPIAVVPLAPLPGEQIVKIENPSVKCLTASSADISVANDDSTLVLPLV